PHPSTGSGVGSVRRRSRKASDTELVRPAHVSRETSAKSASNGGSYDSGGLVENTLAEHLDTHVGQPILLDLLRRGFDLRLGVTALQQRELSPIAQKWRSEGQK